MPEAARRDFVQWGPFPTAAQQFGLLLQHEVPANLMLQAEPTAIALQDDRPVNEYCFLNRFDWRHPVLSILLALRN
jgi:hypothetical protein